MYTADVPENVQGVGVLTSNPPIPSFFAVHFADCAVHFTLFPLGSTGP